MGCPEETQLRLLARLGILKDIQTDALLRETLNHFGGSLDWITGAGMSVVGATSAAAGLGAGSEGSYLSGLLLGSAVGGFSSSSAAWWGSVVQWMLLLFTFCTCLWLVKWFHGTLA